MPSTSTAGRRRWIFSLERDDLIVVTPEGDRFAPTSCARPFVDQRGHRRPRSKTPSGGPPRRPRRPTPPGQTWPVPGRPWPRAHDALSQAERALDRHTSARGAAAADARRTVEEVGRLGEELAAARQAVAEAGERLAAVQAERERLVRSLPEIEEAAAAWRTLAEHRLAVDQRRQELEIRVAGLAERRRVLAERQAEVERRLLGHAEERATAGLAPPTSRGGGDRVDPSRGGGRGGVHQARWDLRHPTRRLPGPGRCRPGRGARLEQLRRDRQTTEQRLDAVRSRTRALDLETNEVALRSETLHEHIVRELEQVPNDLAGLPIPEVPENTTLPVHAAELERKLVALGPVNPLALEELSTLEERHKELEAQVDDVRGARRELHEVVRTLDHEIMTSFAAAAADVNERFSTLVALLFPGGTGRMELTEPEDLLNTGVEIEVRPAGRNVRRLSLLSGGERSMVAVAFLFAVFRSRPSPFYILDEVEAALDDVNLHAVCSASSVGSATRRN